jgi:purine-binding chemotaxis protein CheW
MKRQFCSFRLGDLLMGIEVDKVQEVLRFHETTPVPLAPPAVCGLINLRGQIVTAIDLRSRAGLEPATANAGSMNIILSEEHGSLSFVVDSVGDVMEVDDEDFETPPETLKGNARRLIRGAYKLESQLLLVIDSAFALEVSQQLAASEREGLGR